MKASKTAALLLCGTLLLSMAGYAAIAPPEDAWRPSSAGAAEAALAPVFLTYDFSSVTLYHMGTKSYTMLDRPNRIRFSAVWERLEPIPGGELGRMLPGLRAIQLRPADGPTGLGSCTLYERGIVVRWQDDSGADPTTYQYTFDRNVYATFLEQLRVIYGYGEKGPLLFGALEAEDIQSVRWNGREPFTDSAGIHVLLQGIHIEPASMRTVASARSILPDAQSFEVALADGTVLSAQYNADEILIRSSAEEMGVCYQFAEDEED